MPDIEGNAAFILVVWVLSPEFLLLILHEKPFGVDLEDVDSYFDP